jgi:hypothetical protein
MISQPLQHAQIAGEAGNADRSPILTTVLSELRTHKPDCTLYSVSDEAHTAPIYAGLYALHCEGLIKLRQRFRGADLQGRLPDLPGTHKLLDRSAAALFVDVNGVGLVCFDVRDGGSYYDEVLPHVALYAKRSFHSHDAWAHKTMALGLNYAAYHDRTSLAEWAKTISRAQMSGQFIKHLARAFSRASRPVGRATNAPTASNLSSPPDESLEGRVLFLARTWDTHEAPGEKNLERINETRAECIRALRQAFGARFFGGLVRTAFALKRYPDCVVPEDVRTSRTQYLKRLRRFPICIATTGLHQSVGWKFVEYV